MIINILIILFFNHNFFIKWKQLIKKKKYNKIYQNNNKKIVNKSSHFNMNYNVKIHLTDILISQNLKICAYNFKKVIVRRKIGAITLMVLNYVKILSNNFAKIRIANLCTIINLQNCQQLFNLRINKV